jgi:hypothetical protein
MSGQDSVRAIAEADATGETAELYADIRGVLGAGVVNLIWRHLATMPGALRWVWSSVRPLYVEQAPIRASILRSELTLPNVTAYSIDTLLSAGISQSDLAQIQTVLASYHHTNALALVVLSAIVVDDAPAKIALADTRNVSLPPTGAMPVLPAMSDLAPAAARLVEELNGFGEDVDTALIASMYRHLAHWPAYLALTRTMLAPLERDGTLRSLVGTARLRANFHGTMLAAHLQSNPRPSSSVQALAACRRFVEHPIARMTVVCSIMRHATPAG